MKMVVGLGNPGRKYLNTRHNVGYAVVERMAEKAGTSFRRSWRFPVQTSEMPFAGEPVLLVKPLTYMNSSGEAIGPLMRKKGIEPQNVVVVIDDVELDLGVLRLRRSGSAGGHNGLQSVVEQVGTDDVPRVRVGVGRLPPGDSRVEYVLGTFRPDERERIERAVERAADAVLSIFQDGIDVAMNKFNGKGE